MFLENGLSVLGVGTVLDIILKSTLFLIMITLLSFMVKGASARIRHTLWSLACISLLLLPLLTAVLPHWNVSFYPPLLQNLILSPSRALGNGTLLAGREQPAIRASFSDTKSIVLEEQGAGHILDNQPLIFGISTSLPLRVFNSLFVSIPWFEAVIVIWMSGVLICLLRLVIGRLGVWRLIRTGVEVHWRPWLSLTNRIKTVFHLQQPVRLVQSDLIRVPMAFGIKKPIIFLPSAAETWSWSRRQVVLLHELAHIKRRDYLIQLIGHLTITAYWFHPLAWLLYGQLLSDQERACDEMAITVGIKPTDYARQLLDLARTLQPLKCSSLATVSLARQSTLEKRLVAILSKQSLAKGTNMTTKTILFMLTFSLVACIAMIQPYVRADTSDAALQVEKAEPEPAVSEEFLGSTDQQTNFQEKAATVDEETTIESEKEVVVTSNTDVQILTVDEDNDLDITIDTEEYLQKVDLELIKHEIEKARAELTAHHEEIEALQQEIQQSLQAVDRNLPNGEELTSQIQEALKKAELELIQKEDLKEDILEQVERAMEKLEGSLKVQENALKKLKMGHNKVIIVGGDDEDQKRIIISNGEINTESLKILRDHNQSDGVLMKITKEDDDLDSEAGMKTTILLKKENEWAPEQKEKLDQALIKLEQKLPRTVTLDHKVHDNLVTLTISANDQDLSPKDRKKLNKAVDKLLDSVKEVTDKADSRILIKKRIGSKTTGKVEERISLIIGDDTREDIFKDII